MQPTYSPDHQQTILPVYQLPITTKRSYHASYTYSWSPTNHPTSLPTPDHQQTILPCSLPSADHQETILAVYQLPITTKWSYLQPTNTDHHQTNLPAYLLLITTKPSYQPTYSWSPPNHPTNSWSPPNHCHGHIEICKSTTQCFHMYYVENII